MPLTLTLSRLRERELKCVDTYAHLAWSCRSKTISRLPSSAFIGNIAAQRYLVVSQCHEPSL
ncbi:MAG: hypothetical protein WAO71_08245 [Gallionella sp.]